MSRAALLIGVSKSGDLPELQAVEDGIDAMAAWAHSQPDMAENITIVTDKDTSVTVERLEDAIDAILAAGPPEQLIVYFAGHGFSKSTSEYWLLSKAPRRVGQAIDLTASLEFARRVGVRHVVFISDACRTAPEGINAQPVTGTSLFPNIDVYGKTWIDLYYATRVGDPALEIQDKDVSAERYTSLFTSVFVRALLGDPSELLTAATDGGPDGALTTWTLSENLPGLVTSELVSRDLDFRLVQEPEGRIESGTTSVISKVTLKRGAKLSETPRTADRVNVVQQINESLHQLIEDGLDGATLDRVLTHLDTLRPVDEEPTTVVSRLSETTATLSPTFGAPHHETGSGLKARGGNTIAEVMVGGGDAFDVRPDGAATHIADSQLAVNSLVTFTSGHLAVIPLLEGWFAVMTFDDGGTNLIAVDYEPMDYHPRYPEVADTIDSRRSIRALVTAASREGALNPDLGVQQDLDRWLGNADGLDPTLAIYRAYAPSIGDGHDNAADREADRQLRTYTTGLQAVLFDLVMLGRRAAAMDGDSAARLRLPSGADGRTFPAFPMLTQGWPLQRVYGPELPASLATLGEHVVSSHWTLFAPTAEPLLLDAFTQGDL